jgi:hypothetical protein
MSNNLANKEKANNNIIKIKNRSKQKLVQLKFIFLMGVYKNNTLTLCHIGQKKV